MLVCAEGSENAFDTSHVAELLYALGIKEISELDRTQRKRTRVDIALAFDLCSKRFGLCFAST